MILSSETPNKIHIPLKKNNNNATTNSDCTTGRGEHSCKQLTASTVWQEYKKNRMSQWIKLLNSIYLIVQLQPTI